MRLASGDRVLVVCTGNICRSPFGALWLADRCERSRVSVEVSSAGTHALVGNPPTPEAIAAARDLRLDISSHRARQVTAAIAGSMTVVVAMTAAHGRAVGPLLGDSTRLVVLEIEDPYGGPIDEYRQCYRDIVEALGPMLPESG